MRAINVVTAPSEWDARSRHQNHSGMTEGVRPWSQRHPRGAGGRLSGTAGPEQRPRRDRPPDEDPERPGRRVGLWQGHSTHCPRHEWLDGPYPFRALRVPRERLHAEEPDLRTDSARAGANRGMRRTTETLNSAIDRSGGPESECRTRSPRSKGCSLKVQTNREERLGPRIDDTPMITTTHERGEPETDARGTTGDRRGGRGEG